jgi:large subunit ribosomal protein L30
MAQLKITLTRSCIGRPELHRRIIRSLGLLRLHHSVIHGDTPTIRGMINKVPHMVRLEQIEEVSEKPQQRQSKTKSKTATGM